MGRNTLAGLAVLGSLALTACGNQTSSPPKPDGELTHPPQAAARADASALSAEGMDDCALVTAEDVRRITGYDTSEQRGFGSGCGWVDAAGRFSVTAVSGRYVDLRPSLGGTHVPLSRGLTGLQTSTGWLTTVIYPDGTSASLVISGSAFSQPSTKADLRVTLADGREVEAAELYRAFAEAIVANSR